MPSFAIFQFSSFSVLFCGAPVAQIYTVFHYLLSRRSAIIFRHLASFCFSGRRNTSVSRKTNIAIKNGSSLFSFSLSGRHHYVWSLQMSCHKQWLLYAMFTPAWRGFSPWEINLRKFEIQIDKKIRRSKSAVFERFIKNVRNKNISYKRELPSIRVLRKFCFVFSRFQFYYLFLFSCTQSQNLGRYSPGNMLVPANDGIRDGVQHDKSQGDKYQTEYKTRRALKPIKVLCWQE